jgi:hypothetical protein
MNTSAYAAEKKIPTEFHVRYDPPYESMDGGSGPVDSNVSATDLPGMLRTIAGDIEQRSLIGQTPGMIEIQRIK